MSCKADDDKNQGFHMHTITALNDTSALAPDVEAGAALYSRAFLAVYDLILHNITTYLAWQSLLKGECDVAMAGAVSIKSPQKQGTKCGSLIRTGRPSIVPGNP